MISSVMVVANDATVKGGAYYPEAVKKHVRAQDRGGHDSITAVPSATGLTSSSAGPQRDGYRFYLKAASGVPP